MAAGIDVELCPNVWYNRKHQSAHSSAAALALAARAGDIPEIKPVSPLKTPAKKVTLTKMTSKTLVVAFLTFVFIRNCLAFAVYIISG